MSLRLRLIDYGLRDYGTAQWVGGTEGCDHTYAKGGRNPGTSSKQISNAGTTFSQYEKVCKRCGAQRVDSQIGLEETPEQYVEKLVQVFREVRRVLKDDGTVWLNLGDSYASNGEKTGKVNNQSSTLQGGKTTQAIAASVKGKFNYGVKPKDLIGIPWMVAFALRADGWWLRSDIIWHKPNPMPESVTDRPTKSHEYLFLLTKSAQYFYDAEAIAEPVTQSSIARLSQDIGSQVGSTRANGGAKTNGNMKAVYKNLQPDGQEPNTMHLKRANGEQDTQYPARNKRSVWTVSTQPFSGAHFATFPPKLIEPCIKAGTSEKGECPECGRAWVRVVDRILTKPGTTGGATPYDAGRPDGMTLRAGGFGGGQSTTMGWAPQCTCNKEPVPQIVLDPFGGSGTTSQVARRLNRYSVCLDLSLNYLQTCARERLQLTALDEFQNGKRAESNHADLPLFSEMEL